MSFCEDSSLESPGINRAYLLGFGREYHFSRLDTVETRKFTSSWVSESFRGECPISDLSTPKDQFSNKRREINPRVNIKPLSAHTREPEVRGRAFAIEKGAAPVMNLPSLL
jgi:hypothetical protein